MQSHSEVLGVMLQHVDSGGPVGETQFSPITEQKGTGILDLKEVVRVVGETDA